MKYDNVKEARFISRENRFIAYVELDGAVQRVHVKNTGRCKELLQEGVSVFLTKSSNPNRKTAYDLVGVKKGDRMINMDSYAPNLAVGEWLLKEKLIKGITHLKAEHTFGRSRFDFYVQTDHSRILIEVKGVTLEENNAVYFPDAPSERALKHVSELIQATKEGYEAYLIFVVQMKGVNYFSPNRSTQPAFADILQKAKAAGVKIVAYDCRVEQDEMGIMDEVPVVLDELERIADPLLVWYDAAHRILPWREEPTPYRVWVSEIMLQQTRVEAVKPYFDRFMGAVPNQRALAVIDQERLMKLWEGLGYYRRAANLKKAAQEICEKYEGEIPSTYEEIISLPGIGSYTAGAVASIAFGEAVPAVDGNVLRILSRLRMDDEDILSQKTKTRVERELKTVMPRTRPGDFNQALMELGATVCLPNGAPKCSLCPWNGFCRAFCEGRMEEYPKKAAKKAKKTEQKTILIIKDENKTAFRKRPDQGLLAGLYEFPTLEGRLDEGQVLRYMEEKGWKVLRIQPAGDAKHVFTHRIWEMTGYVIKVDELEQAAGLMKKEGFLFIDKEQAADRYPIPSAYAAYLHHLTG